MHEHQNDAMDSTSQSVANTVPFTAHVTGWFKDQPFRDELFALRADVATNHIFPAFLVFQHHLNEFTDRTTASRLRCNPIRNFAHFSDRDGNSYA